MSKVRGETVGWLEQPDSLRAPVAVRFGSPLLIGRASNCGLVLEHPSVSGEHASISWRDGAVLVKDHGSKNGTYLNGRRLEETGMRLSHGATLRIGNCELRYLEDRERGVDRAAISSTRFSLGQDLVVGRDPACDIVLNEPAVSRRHARIRVGDPPVIEDLGSRGGVRIQGAQQRLGPLREGEVAGISHYELRHERGTIVVTDQRRGEALRADQVSVGVAGRVILQPVSLSVGPGEMLALIGPSGSGKTTLLKTLVGERSPNRGGSARLGKDAVATRGPDLGYVPQFETIHDRLSVDEVLSFAAKLRLPDDTEDREIDHLVDRVVSELQLQEHRGTRAGDLSGGQRKRLSCGIELIGNPAFLLLDEPTSGLDPALEHHFMSLLRSIADAGRGVLVTTHATSSIGLCDSLAVMTPGGHLAFVGSPEEALQQFDVDTYDELYSRIPESSPAETGVITGSRPDPAVGDSRPPPLPRSLMRQFVLLTTRYGKTFWRDRRTLLALLLQVPVMAVLITTVFPPDVLALPDKEPSKSAVFLFLLITVAIWLGLISSTREITKEKTILRREFAIGVRLSAYLASKLVILVVLTVVQVALLVGVAFAIQPVGGAGPTEYLTLSILFLVCAWAAVAMGLAVSALAKSVDQATSFVPLLLIPQLLYAGAVVPYESMQAVAKAISVFVVARWGFAASGETIDMNGRLAESAADQQTFGTTFFTADPALTIPFIGVFVVAGLVAAAALLARQRLSAG